MESTMTVDQLTNICEISLSYSNKVKPSMRPKILCEHHAYELLLKVWDMDTIELHEKAVVILMNQANRVLGILRHASGSISECNLDLRIIFAAALKAGSTRFILAHNHPSGNLQPSIRDIEITKAISEAGKLMNIKLQDHIIITTEGYCSMVDEGIIL